MTDVEDGVLVEIAARRILRQIDQADVVDWAVSNLGNHLDDTRILELVTVSVDAVDAVLERILATLGVVLDESEAARWAIRSVARQYASGLISAVEAAQLIRGLSWTDESLVGRLAVLHGLIGEWEDDPENRAEYEVDLGELICQVPVLIGPFRL